MPRSRIESARACSGSSSKRRRGCLGLGVISPTGSWRSSSSAGVPGASAVAVDASGGVLTERIADRPRPIPRLTPALGRAGSLGTGGDFLGQLEVRVGADAVRVVVDDRAPVAGRL